MTAGAKEQIKHNPCKANTQNIMAYETQRVKDRGESKMTSFPLWQLSGSSGENQILFPGRWDWFRFGTVKGKNQKHSAEILDGTEVSGEAETTGEWYPCSSSFMIFLQQP